jgi:hypothetical protein
MQKPYISRLVLGLFAVILSGCAAAPSVSIGEKDRQALTRIQVQSEVQLPPHDVYIHGDPIATTIASGGGVVGAIAADSAAKAPKTNVAEFAKANGFPLAQIVKSEFVRAAAAKGGMVFSETEPHPNGFLTLKVNAFGFGQAHGLGATMYPLLNVTATLKRPDGSVVWQDTEFVSPLNSDNKPGHEYAEYINNPENMRKALARAAAIVSGALASDLYRSK